MGELRTLARGTARGGGLRNDGCRSPPDRQRRCFSQDVGVAVCTTATASVIAEAMPANSDLKVSSSPVAPMIAGASKGKIAETFFAFAEPLLHADPDGPGDLETLRSVLQLVEMCWNLPVLDALGERGHEATKASFEAVVSRCPPAVAQPLQQLLADRKRKYGEVPYLVSVQVLGETLHAARIVVEARTLV